MPPSPRSVAKLATRIVLLFLAFAVFSWGMQAKVSLYKIHTSSSAVAAAKLLTEERTEQISIAHKVLENLVGSSEMFRLIAFAFPQRVTSFPSFRLRQLKVSLYRPCGCNSRSIGLMRRPPPVPA